jgi:hypothetical protein
MWLSRYSFASDMDWLTLSSVTLSKRPRCVSTFSSPTESTTTNHWRILAENSLSLSPARSASDSDWMSSL